MKHYYTTTARFISIIAAITLATMALSDQSSNPLVWVVTALLVISLGYTMAKEVHE